MVKPKPDPNSPKHECGFPSIKGTFCKTTVFEGVIPPPITPSPRHVVEQSSSNPTEDTSSALGAGEGVIGGGIPPYYCKKHADK